MISKLYACWLDVENGSHQRIVSELPGEVYECLPVRVVAHHMRLLGILYRLPRTDTLVLIHINAMK